MTDEEGNLEQKTQNSDIREFPSKIGAYCLECGTAKEFYFIGIQKNPKGVDFALYNCSVCRHTFSYNTLIGEERK